MRKLLSTSRRLTKVTWTSGALVSVVIGEIWRCPAKDSQQLCQGTSHATSWLEQTKGIRLFNQTSYPSFVVSCPMQFDPCESVKWRHGMDPWRTQRGWEARTDDASAVEIWYWLEMWRTGADREHSSYSHCGRDHRFEYSSSTDCERDRRGEQILDCVKEHPESLLWGNQSVSWMSLCETNKPVDPISCRLSDVLVKSTDLWTCTLCFQFLLVVHSCSDFSWTLTIHISSAISCLKSLCTFDLIIVSLCWTSAVVDRVTNAKENVRNEWSGQGVTCRFVSLTQTTLIRLEIFLLEKKWVKPVQKSKNLLTNGHFNCHRCGVLAKQRKEVSWHGPKVIHHHFSLVIHVILFLFPRNRERPDLIHCELSFVLIQMSVKIFFQLRIKLFKMIIRHVISIHRAMSPIAPVQHVKILRNLNHLFRKTKDRLQIGYITLCFLYASLAIRSNSCLKFGCKISNVDWKYAWICSCHSLCSMFWDALIPKLEIVIDVHYQLYLPTLLCEFSVESWRSSSNLCHLFGHPWHQWYRAPNQ